MTVAELKDHFRSRGWKDDGHGHLQKTTKEGRRYRVKFGKLSARYEIRVSHDSGGEWMRLRSAYYKQITVSPDTGKLKGFE